MSDFDDGYDEYETLSIEEILEVVFEKLAIIEAKLDMFGNLVVNKNKDDMH